MRYQIYYQPDDNAYYFSEVKNNSLNYISDVEIIATGLDFYQAKSICNWLCRLVGNINNFNLNFIDLPNDILILRLDKHPKYNVDELRMILHED
jgi:hypothetical protein